MWEFFLFENGYSKYKLCVQFQNGWQLIFLYELLITIIIIESLSNFQITLPASDYCSHPVPLHAGNTAVYVWSVYVCYCRGYVRPLQPRILNTHVLMLDCVWVFVCVWMFMRTPLSMCKCMGVCVCVCAPAPRSLLQPVHCERECWARSWPTGGY